MDEAIESFDLFHPCIIFQLLRILIVSLDGKIYLDKHTSVCDNQDESRRCKIRYLGWSKDPGPPFGGEFPAFFIVLKEGAKVAD